MLCSRRAIKADIQAMRDPPSCHPGTALQWTAMPKDLAAGRFFSGVINSAA